MLKKLTTLVLATGLFFVVAAPIAVKAQDDQSTYSIESIGAQIGLGENDLKTAVIKVLNIALGFLALVAVIMIIWGGFTWLTAAGSEEKVDKAKKIISAAVIGLIIVLLAWAVVTFVAKTAANVTTNETA